MCSAKVEGRKELAGLLAISRSGQGQEAHPTHPYSGWVIQYAIHRMR